MSNPKALYIIHYFSRALTAKERLAAHHLLYLGLYNAYYSNASDEKKLKQRRIYTERGLLTKDEEALSLLKDGTDAFEENLLKRVMDESAEKIYFNYCPRCGQLARTPQARQCRYCSYNWHNIVAAEFNVTTCFQVTNRPFFILGEIVKGQVNKGHFIDLTFFGLNAKPEIVAVEFEEGKDREEIGLGITELTDEQKKYLLDIKSFRTIDILNNHV